MINFCCPDLADVTAQLSHVVTSLSQLRTSAGVLEEELASMRARLESVLALPSCITCLSIDPSQLTTPLDFSNVSCFIHSTFPHFIASFACIEFQIPNLTDNMLTIASLNDVNTSQLVTSSLHDYLHLSDAIALATTPTHSSTLQCADSSSNHVCPASFHSIVVPC